MYHEDDGKKAVHGKEKREHLECAMKDIDKESIMVKYSVYKMSRKDEV